MNRSAGIRVCVCVRKNRIFLHSFLHSRPFSRVWSLVPFDFIVHRWGHQAKRWQRRRGETDREGSRNYSLTLLNLFSTHDIYSSFYSASIWFFKRRLAVRSSTLFSSIFLLFLLSANTHTQIQEEAKKKTILKFTIALSTIYYLALLFLRLSL